MRRKLFRIIGLLCWPLAIWYGIVSAQAPASNLYLPLAARLRHALLGLEAVPGAMAAHLANLTAIGPDWLRSNFGSQVDAYDSLYQHYIAGGWAEVDGQLVAELALWDLIGAEPLIVFMRGGLPCKVPTTPQLTVYGDFILAAADRYGLERFEVWNEPDVSGGFPSLFGCWGTAHASKLIYLLDYVRTRTDRLVGVSYQAGSQTQMNFLLATAPHADWIGIHHYADWVGGVVKEPVNWPGGVMQKYNAATAAGVPVWVTELNLVSFGNECGPAHQAKQADYVMDALNLPLPMVSVLVYYKYPDWACSGIRTTQLENELMGSGYPAPGQ